MNKLYYGNGECTIEGNAILVVIKYRGAVVIRDKSPKGYYLTANSNTITISPFKATEATLNELFTYEGELRIISVKTYYNDVDSVPTTIKRVMDYSELLNTNAEDMTTNSENLNKTHISGNKVNKTRLLVKTIKDLHTGDEGSSKLLLNGEDYSGSYHIHIGTGVIMAGARHSKDSQVLTIKPLGAK